MTTQLENLVSKFKDVFTVRDSMLTQTNLVKRNIDTRSSHPTKQRTGQVPVGARQE